MFEQYVAFVSLSANSVFCMQLTFVSIWQNDEEKKNNDNGDNIQLNKTIYGWTV